MTEKAPNYTEANEARLREVYVPTATQDERVAQVASLASELGKSTRSIIAKLTTMQLYVPKEYRTKTGAKSVRKETIVTAIAIAVGVADLPGLEKANKNSLIRINNAFVERDEAIAFLESDEGEAAEEVS
jgi:hypothetical protein